MDGRVVVLLVPYTYMSTRSSLYVAAAAAEDAWDIDWRLAKLFMYATSTTRDGMTQCIIASAINVLQLVRPNVWIELLDC